MVSWVFGYGSLIWKAGFPFDQRLVGFIRGYRRVFYQVTVQAVQITEGLLRFPVGPSPWNPTLANSVIQWGVAYRISGEEDEKMAMEHLEVREKQYDKKVYLDFYTDPNSTSSAVCGVLVYIASPNKDMNRNYLGPASLHEMANQIIYSEGPSGPNRDYLFQLENALMLLGCEDMHVKDLADMVRKILSDNNTSNL